MKKQIGAKKSPRKMLSPEDTWFSISFSSSSSLLDATENYVTSIEGTMLCLDDDDTEQLAGKLQLFYIDIASAQESGESLFDLFDIEGATAPFYSILFDARTGDYKQSISELVGDEIWGRNLLILDRLEIVAEFRGYKLGLACLNRCIQQYSHGCALVAIKCFPLQFEVDRLTSKDEWAQRMQFDKLSRHLKSSRRKLQEYYARLGFYSVARTEFMVLSPSFRRPTLHDLGFE